jgi:serine/threonine protein kinase
LLEKKRFTKDETKFYMAELLEALDTVHKSGLVHRDVKPDNMVLSSTGHLKLLDFGLCSSEPISAVHPSRGVTNDAVQDDRTHGNVGKSRRAELKSVVGTPQYMAPEVYRGACGVESDIWALGIITFECLIGRVPFHSGNCVGMEAHKMVRDKVLRHQDIFPRLLGKAVERSLMKPVSRDFLLKVVCERQVRLTAEECRRDPFFFWYRLPSIAPDVAAYRSALERTQRLLNVR